MERIVCSGFDMWNDSVLPAKAETAVIIPGKNDVRVPSVVGLPGELKREAKP